MCIVKLKFLVIILTHESSVHCEIEILVVILAHSSRVHFKIEISNQHYTPFHIGPTPRLVRQSFIFHY